MEKNEILCGDYVIYQNDDMFEIGRVKRAASDGVYVWYDESTIAKKTPFNDIKKLLNGQIIKMTSLGGLENRQIVSIVNNRVNLCDSCKRDFPECFVTSSEVIFGDGTGNDNVCACAYYEPVSKRT